ncbi:MAG: multidrug ABC transporter ATP-binding protein [Elusimicrobia bacterium GWA2_69_24]|nr:MAG: multidrug ABC transporter ATP-binding protein [Elusimicrobia bacterium GWA2_69_24]HBL18136.1 multidrug ABC transporter ATP-binding protein [Elusimicrobiota bacterium]
MSALVVLGLTKRYGGFEAVRGIDFSVGAGEIFALVGPNGAGKSTTLKIAATILTPTGGSVSVFGLDLRRSPEQVRGIISYLPEEAGAYRNLTGRAYLRFMAALFLESPAGIAECVSYGAGLSGLGARLDDRIKTYSKGMTRKLLLARAVMTRPKLAILDEPTSGLDVANAVEIRRTIRALAREGMSFLVSSHNMLEVEFLSDRVAIMSGGRILACAAAGELKREHAAGNLEEVFMRLTRP